VQKFAAVRRGVSELSRKGAKATFQYYIDCKPAEKLILLILLRKCQGQRSRELNKSRAIAGRTARCCCKFGHVSNFATASCGFSATARLSCIHQWPFKYWNYTQYADFFGGGAKPKITAHDPMPPIWSPNGGSSPPKLGVQCSKVLVV